MREEIVPQVVLDVARGADENPARPEAAVAGNEANREQDAAVCGQLSAGDAARQVVDRVAKYHRRREGDRSRDDDATEAEQEVVAVPKGIAEQTAKRRHVTSIVR